VFPSALIAKCRDLVGISSTGALSAQIGAHPLQGIEGSQNVQGPQAEGCTPKPPAGSRRGGPERAHPKGRPFSNLAQVALPAPPLRTRQAHPLPRIGDPDRGPGGTY
jgi:hypothetical protein